MSDIAVPESPPGAITPHTHTFYIAPRNGGIWKTTNNGTTFTPLFNDQPTLSMGAIAVAPSDPNTLWVGSGDASCTRSATRGNGAYKSTDAGATWQHVGLPGSHHIARIAIHPTDPNIVYIAAMGHLYSPNDERGLFKTTDGGKSWQRVLFINSRTGAIDLVLNRKNPDVLYAATYECMRDPWRLHDGGPGTAIHKSTDAGATWEKLANGLPAGRVGRIGLDIYQKNSDTLVAVIDNRNTVDPAAATRPAGPDIPLPPLIGGECYRTDDAGKSWRKVSRDGDDLSRKSGYAFNQLRIDPNNPDRYFITGAGMIHSEDGGKTWIGLTGGAGGTPTPGLAQGRQLFRRAFGDFRTFWIDSINSNRMIAGSDGGIFLSYDGGLTCDYLANFPGGEVYALTVDMEDPYHIYAGLQDHESWKGPSNGWSGNVNIDDWSTVGIGDGMYNQVDPTDSRWVYNTQEFGRHARLDQKTRIRTTITPPASLAEGARLRYNWVAPLRLSPHDPKTLYAGAQFLFRSTNRGDSWEKISPDLTTNDPKKISPQGAAIQHCTITTISESPVQAGLVWVGTDDGKVQVTRDAGAAWTDATSKLSAAGAPEDAWVTRVFASHHEAGTAFVAKNRFRQDDFRPFIFKTTDFGDSWSPIHGNLPPGALHVVFEDNKNPNLLFVGTDHGVFTSVDGGRAWSHLRANMPSVTVTDLLVHPRDGDLVAGTYGRGVWVTNITPLRELSNALLSKDAHLFATYQRTPQHEGSLGNYRLYGDRFVSTPNAPSGPVFTYYLKDSPPAAQRVSITIADAAGNTVRTLPGTSRAGMNRVTWNPSTPAGRGGGGGAGGGAGGGGAGARGTGATTRSGAAAASQTPLPAGEYTVTLHVGDHTLSHKAHLSFVPSTDLGGDDVDEH
jgi:photosystem II stability/assembly factor-like uncharacterized protein